MHENRYITVLIVHGGSVSKKPSASTHLTKSLSPILPGVLKYTTDKKENWITVNPKTEKSTGTLNRESCGKSSVNLQWAPVHDWKIDRGTRTAISIYKNWLSLKLLLAKYSSVTEKNWIREYSSINLKAWNVVVSDALPSLRRVIMQEMS